MVDRRFEKSPYKDDGPYPRIVGEDGSPLNYDEKLAEFRLKVQNEQRPELLDGGWLSPRMRDLMIRTLEVTYDEESFGDDFNWSLIPDEELCEKIQAYDRRRMKSFKTVLKQILETFRYTPAPTSDKVLKRIRNRWGSEREFCNPTKLFFDDGGRIENVIDITLRLAKLSMENFWVDEDEPEEQLPVTLFDEDYDLVRIMCFDCRCFGYKACENMMSPSWKPHSTQLDSTPEEKINDEERMGMQTYSPQSDGRPGSSDANNELSMPSSNSSSNSVSPPPARYHRTIAAALEVELHPPKPLANDSKKVDSQFAARALVCNLGTRSAFSPVQPKCLTKSMQIGSRSTNLTGQPMLDFNQGVVKASRCSDFLSTRSSEDSSDYNTIRFKSNSEYLEYLSQKEAQYRRQSDEIIARMETRKGKLNVHCE